jgi:hypothetical protein
MAHVDYNDYDSGPAPDWVDTLPRAGRMGRIVHIAGAVCSVALILGMVAWGYRIAVRDVNGIPVVRAMEGPMRIAPKDPGGEIADHQGLAVNTVAALGTAAPPPDRLVLAPRPVELSPEDAPAMALAGAMPQAPGDQAAVLSAAAVAPAVAAPQAPAAADAALGPDPDAVAQALAEALAEPVVEQVAARPETTASGQLRPRPRPTAPGQESALTTVALTNPAEGTPPMAEIDPAAIPMGTRLVQLGAFDTAEEARAEWVKLGNQFGPLFLGKALVVQAAESGGRTFFRLRAHGFADETEARGFCTEMLAQNASCIPVEQRG